MRCWTWIGGSAAVAILAGATSLLGSAPADATRPENDRIVQLERQVADLQRRLERLEASQGVRPAVQFFTPENPYFTPVPDAVPGTDPSAAPRTTYLPPNLPWTSVVPQLVPVPPPPPDAGQDINGVKFKIFLLSSEQEKKPVDPQTPFQSGGISITR
ncbi:MAG: hypothetical protein B7Z55_01830 [Planctomycetales bacterium 12-60-4]|nr:MAG: hypothetical protein B7Z55_01830 [Planctomycetales bacterium 12-60-4]